MKTHEISSPQNPAFKTFLELLTSKGIKEHRRAFIFGKKAVAETWERHRDAVRGVVLPADTAGDHERFMERERDIEIYKLKNALFDDLDVFGSHAPFLLVEPPGIAIWNFEQAGDGCTLYVPFQDPSNVGAVLRSAAAFGVNQVVLGEGAAHPFHPRSVRAASGTLFHHTFFKAPSPDFLQSAEESGVSIMALEAGGEPIARVKFPVKFVLVPGAEGPGLQNKKFKNKIGIPISSDVESLNATVATSIALFAWRSSLK